MKGKRSVSPTATFNALGRFYKRDYKTGKEEV